MRLLEAPGPLVLVVVILPSWWRQQGKTGVALGAIFTRRVPPGALARLVLPAVLTRPVAPLLTRATVVPASSAASSSSAVAPVVALGASTEAPSTDGPEFLAIIGVLAVYGVEGAERMAALRRLGVVPAALCIWICRDHGYPLVLHVLGLGFLLF